MRCILESVGDEPPSRMWFQSSVEQLGKHPPVCRVAHRVDGRQPGDSVIRLVQADGEFYVPSSHHQRVGTKRADRPRDIAAHSDAVLKHSVGILKEIDLSHADLVRSFDLLTYPQLRCRLR